ncbi:MAG: LysR family transcriptional regulator [Pseudomonadota bacterium]
MNMITFEQLRVLQAIVTHGTFRAAAKALHKSQPALSAMIRNLEAECGFSLFSRDTYRPELTREGRVFYDRAVATLREMGRLNALAGRLSGKEEPEISVAINTIYCVRPLLPTLKHIDETYPATRMNVTTEVLGGAIEGLREGRTDIALTTDTDFEPTTMELLPFDSVRVIPVARPDFPPAIAGRYNTVDDMRAYVQVLVADSSAGERRQSQDVLPEVRHWIVSDVEAKKDIISGGLGWGGLPEYAVQDELASGELVQLHVEGFGIRTSQLYVIRRTDTPIGPVADALWQALRRLAADQRVQRDEAPSK